MTDDKFELPVITTNPCRGCTEKVLGCTCLSKDYYEKQLSQRDADLKAIQPLYEALKHVQHAFKAYSRNNPDWDYVIKQVDKALEGKG